MGQSWWRPRSQETLDACRRADAILKGPVGDPNIRNLDGTEAGLLGGLLRQGLDLYANVRPIKLDSGKKKGKSKGKGKDKGSSDEDSD